MSGLTTWSDGDVIQKVGNTDHWSKMKIRALQSKSSQFAVQDELLATKPVGSSSCEPRKHLLQNSYNSKAKEGFRYWDIHRPKPTKYGRYGLGSYKTFLGLGSAPRT
ncbi:hypothetical protein Btru_053282 [Bulinus truncatus]|nr:hypothetical protein Btru_053282 [Bulinus truncatus]